MGDSLSKQIRDRAIFKWAHTYFFFIFNIGYQLYFSQSGVLIDVEL